MSKTKDPPAAVVGMRGARPVPSPLDALTHFISNRARVAQGPDMACAWLVFIPAPFPLAPSPSTGRPPPPLSPRSCCRLASTSPLDVAPLPSQPGRVGAQVTCCDVKPVYTQGRSARMCCTESHASLWTVKNV